MRKLPDKDIEHMISKRLRLPHFKPAVRFVVLAVALCFFTQGCGFAPGKKKNENMQDDYHVAGFLYHFDQREEALKFVKYMNSNDLPPEVTWYYPDEETRRKLKTAKDTGEDATEAAEAFASEGMYTTSDTDRIIEIYNALNNIIVVGSGNNSTTEVQFFIRFLLPDESTCTYEFISENTIRLSGQNYTIESDGNLWKSLREE